jgi:hypothetical protein
MDGPCSAEAIFVLKSVPEIATLSKTGLPDGVFANKKIPILAYFGRPT